MDQQNYLISPSLSLEQLNLDPPVKLGIMASGNGSNFEALIQAIADGKLRAVIPLLIYNNPGAKVAARAQLWGVPAILLNHRDFSRREDLDRKIVEKFQEAGVELIVMAGWMRVVTPVLLDAFPGKIVNIHPSLLPSFKGIRAVEQALAANVKITGCTAHLVSLEVDSGQILLQAAVPILPDDTSETLHKRIQVREHQILPQAIAIATQESRQREFN
ncbi:MAG: phosphoribosylglycinamide formyltransferase [Oscillatoria sp. PMC 1051.18]|nr:phosphoribosylglycinamide formyltransferase [Oscillatoria sp. PMC 1050.18]MEC5028858.1 phosphoribosylglycinamide formyltransferase [Oscillatoria sp. PMC 1051.18]